MHSKNELPERVAAQLAPLVPAQSAILIGLSGGVDSVTLLHLLNEVAPRFAWRLSALHVHHGLSPNADAWATFCADLCKRYGVPLHVERIDIAPLREHGIEAAARRLRHAAFARQPADFVALAHHADDQAETMLLQLLRGAGVKGVAAMPLIRHAVTPVHSLLARNGARGRKLPSLNLLRPLLHCSRCEILGYAIAHGLRWIEDESNADENYPRNFLRHRVLPLLEEKFPACRDTLARNARHFAEASELLDDLAQFDAQNSPPSRESREYPATLETSRLHALSRPRAKNLLRWFLHQCGAPMPQTAQLDDMLRQLCGARQDAAVCIAYDGWEVRRYQGRIHALHAPGRFDPALVLPWRGEPELDWPALQARLCFERVEGTGISLAKLQSAPVTLRLRSGGETLRPHPAAATRTLKNLLQEHHVPPWRRDRLPLLYCGDRLACVADMVIDAEFQAGQNEAAIRIGCYPQQESSPNAAFDRAAPRPHA